MTIKLALELPIDRAFFCILTPVPGTEAFEHAKQEALISNINDLDFSTFNYNTVSLQNNNISAKKLLWLQKYAYQRFYFRPKIFFNLIKNVNTRKKIYIHMKKFKNFYFTKNHREKDDIIIEKVKLES